MKDIKILDPYKHKDAKLKDLNAARVSYVTEGNLTASFAGGPSDVRVPLMGGDKTDSYFILKEKVKVKELAPEIFAYLRYQDGIEQMDISHSLSPENNINAVFKAGESQGKSGSFFFFSDDKRFIIKTMTNGDLATFKKAFTKYVEHVGRHQGSFLARIYGIYTIQMSQMDPVHLILMGNTKRTLDDSKTLRHVFDLKGSLVNREVKGKRGKQFKPTTTLKDTNIIKMQMFGETVSSLIITSNSS